MNDLVQDDTVSYIQSLTCPHLVPSGIMTNPGGGTGTLTPGGLKTGPVMICPLDKDIQVMKNMIKQGVNADWIAKFYLKTGSLQKMLKYYKELKTLFDYLPASVSKMDKKTTSLAPSSTLDTCQPTDVENAVSRIFCEDGEDDILTVARKNGGGYFVDLLWASGLANEMLRSGDEYILVVPTDASFKKIPKSMRDKMKDNCFLRKLLSYHISKKVKSLTALQSTSKDLLSRNQGKYIYFSETNGKTMYGGSVVLKDNLKATNGHVKIIENIMIPPEKNVASILDAGRKYTVLTATLRQTELAKELRALGSFTLFAPKDDSIFNDATLKMKLTDPQYVLEFVRNHIVKGSYFSNLFNGGKEVTLTSLTGKQITIRKLAKLFTVNGVSVKQQDIRATNGVVHIVDSIINSN